MGPMQESPQEHARDEKVGTGAGWLLSTDSFQKSEASNMDPE